MSTQGSVEPGVEGQSAEVQYGLKFIFPSGEYRIFTALPITIGRGEQNDLILKDDGVSLVHARIYYDERLNDVCIEDLHSLNGVYLDGQPTIKNLLFDDVHIRLGDTSLVFRDTGYIHQA